MPWAGVRSRSALSAMDMGLSGLRVLLVANTLPPRDVSGVGEQVLQLAAGLRGAGAEVEVLGRGPGGVAGPKVLFPLLAVPAVRRAVRRLRPHVVQVHESDGGLAVLALALSPSRVVPRPRRVALLQVSYREERRAVRPLVAAGRVLGRPGRVERRFRLFKAPLQIALGWLTAHAAQRVLAPSAATAAEIRRDYGVREVAVVPNVTGAADAAHAAHAADAADVADAAGAEDAAGAAHATHGAHGAHGSHAAHGSHGSPGSDTAGEAGALVDPRGSGAAEPPGYLLFVGRLRIRKGVDVLLEALAELTRVGTPARLLIAGDGEHRTALERRTAELALGTTVRFLGGVSAERVRGLLRGATALVVPSIYEGMPLVVLEAMAAGRPVVASRVSGIPEVVLDGETGWLVPPEDPRSLAAALAASLAEPQEAERRGAAGRSRVEQLFRPAVAAARWREAVLEGMTDQPQAASSGPQSPAAAEATRIEP